TPYPRSYFLLRRPLSAVFSPYTALFRSVLDETMPNITIDGKQIEVEAGVTVIQAAEKLGIEIPRYCYHPGLSIVGQCRICLVERSEEHTSELQSRENVVCRLLLEKKTHV